jgi:hypothetical protein
MDIDKLLHNLDEDEYGPEYKSHFLEIYKTYLEMADRISSRRQSANSFFLAINTAVVGFIGYVQLGAEGGSAYYYLISLAGMVLCYFWYRLVKSYRGLNSGKFKVIHKLEKNLPISPYDTEWEIVGRGKKPGLYTPFTNVEMRVPWVFFTLHFFVFVASLPWQKVLEWKGFMPR